MRKNKYGNTRSKGLDGYYYASKLEAATANDLYYKEKYGVLRVIGRQIKFNFFADMNKQVFTDPRPKIKGCTKLLGYIADFWVEDVDTSEGYFIEAKGQPNCQDWKRKVAFWLIACDKKLIVYSGSYKKPYIHKPIFPKAYNG